MRQARFAAARRVDEIATDDRPVVLSVGFTLSKDDETWRDFAHVAAASQAQAVALMFEMAPSVVLIDIDLIQGSPIAVADFASYRHPAARVIFISDTEIFSDGSLFAHCSNVHAHIGRGMAEPDVAALVAHHARADAAR